MSELTFKEYIEYNDLLDRGARMVIESEIDPAHLFYIVEGFLRNTARVLGGVGGALAGSALGPAGSIAGGVAGSTGADWLANKFGGGGNEIGPLYDQAKKAFEILMGIK